MLVVKEKLSVGGSVRVSAEAKANKKRLRQ
jgi:hypothetical protein